jgi:hypothetical protein
MTSAEISGLRSAFGQEDASYSYFRDKYALLLAAWTVGEGQRIADVKRSRIAGLLQKDILKQHCARHPVLRETDLLALQNHESWNFRRTFDQWGSEDEWWCQTSRPGINLVLRLDFGLDHDRIASRLRIASAIDALESRNHMHFEESYNLAWCRLDLDWETGEVLIEEIQNDWLRTAQNLLENGQDRGEFLPWYCRQAKADRRNDDRFSQYYQSVIAPLEKVWAEATLTATLEFIRNDLGLRLVYMHTADCGTRIKGMGTWNTPPRSLYTDLPRRFCFQPTTQVPAFLSRSWSQTIYQDEDFADIRKRFARPFSFWKLEL